MPVSGGRRLLMPVVPCLTWHVIAVFLFSMFYSLFSPLCIYADEAAGLKAKIAGRGEDARSSLKQLVQFYVGRGDHDGLISYLKTLADAGYEPLPEIYFYIAEAQVAQIGHWRRTKDWESVYDKAAGLRKDAVSYLRRAEEALAGEHHALRLEIKFLKWRLTYEENPEAGVGLFNDFSNTARDLPAEPGIWQLLERFDDEVAALNDDSLLRRFEDILLAAAQSRSVSDAELKASAEKFLEKKRASAARKLFLVYLERQKNDKARFVEEALRLAGRFGSDDSGAAQDASFAEELYNKASVTGGLSVLDMDAHYRRAFNLERMKDYEKAVQAYKDFAVSYAESPRRGEVYFRMGVLAAFGLKDMAAGEEYFSKAKDFSKGRLAAAALYHLGLIHHAKAEIDQAREFYKAALSTLKSGGFSAEKEELGLLAGERLKELDEKKDMKYGLRLFLDAVLQGATGPGGPPSVSVTAQPATQIVGKPVVFRVDALVSDTGCMAPEYTYEWAGMLGGMANIPGTPELTVEYVSSGLHVACVAVVGPQGPEAVRHSSIAGLPVTKASPDKPDDVSVAGVGFEIVDIEGAEAATEPAPQAKDKKADKPSKSTAVSRALEAFTPSEMTTD